MAYSANDWLRSLRPPQEICSVGFRFHGSSATPLAYEQNDLQMARDGGKHCQQLCRDHKRESRLAKIAWRLAKQWRASGGTHQSSKMVWGGVQERHLRAPQHCSQHRRKLIDSACPVSSPRKRLSICAADLSAHDQTQLFVRAIAGLRPASHNVEPTRAASKSGVSVWSG